MMFQTASPSHLKRSFTPRRIAMSTHLFPTHRYEHDNPEAFLTVAGAILAALVILIALAAVAVASGAAAGA
jgi:hypothetical protein